MEALKNTVCEFKFTSWSKKIVLIIVRHSLYECSFEKKLNVPRYFSNHYVCDILSLFTYEHFINIKLTRFMLWIKYSKSDSFFRYKYYFLYDSIFMTHLALLWQSKYNVPDVLSNDIDALVSRIDLIQNRESSSMYIPLNFNT